MNIPSKHFTDRELFNALRNRDEQAYNQLYAETFLPFRYWVTTNSGSEMDAEDAFHKGMLNFMLNLETGAYEFREGTRVRTVLFDYCKRVWLTELTSARSRTRATMPDTLEVTDTTDVLKDLERLDTVNAVRHSLSQLKDECRKLLEWFYVDELSLREIAERLSIKESSVKSKRYDCAERMKQFFQKANAER